MVTLHTYLLLLFYYMYMCTGGCPIASLGAEIALLRREDARVSSCMQMVRLTLVVFAALHFSPGEALRLHTNTLKQHCKTALVAGFCSAQLLATPAFAAPTLQEAILETTEAAYPVLKALPADTFPAFTRWSIDLEPRSLHALTPACGHMLPQQDRRSLHRLQA